MKHARKQVFSSFLRFADPAISALTLVFSISCLTGSKSIGMKLCAAATFLTLSLSYGIIALKTEDKKGFAFVRSLAFSTIFLACSIVFLAVEDLSLSVPIVVIAYFATLIECRIESFIKNKWLLMRIANVVMALLYVMVILSGIIVFGTEIAATLFVFFAFIVTFKALGHIIVSSFSQMQFGVLMKVIRKTFAGEILFGLLMLVIACSIALPAWEKEITNFYDGLWYCFAVVTTIGFGDFSAASPVGRILTVLLGIYGIIVVALITSIIINFYNEVKSDKPNRLVDNADVSDDIVAGIEDLMLDQPTDADDAPATKRGKKGKKHK